MAAELKLGEKKRLEKAADDFWTLFSLAFFQPPTSFDLGRCTYSALHPLARSLVRTSEDLGRIATSKQTATIARRNCFELRRNSKREGEERKGLKK